MSGHHPPEVSLLLCGRSGSGVPPRLAQPSAHLRASAFLPRTLSHRLCPCLAEGQVLRVRGILQQPREGPAVACGTQQDPYCARLPFGKFPCHPPFCSASGLRIFGHKRALRCPVLPGSAGHNSWGNAEITKCFLERGRFLPFCITQSLSQHSVLLL